MLSYGRTITYRRDHKGNQYKYISIFKQTQNETQNFQKQIAKKPPMYNLNKYIYPHEAKDLGQIIQFIDTVKNNLNFVNAILFEILDDVNLNKLQQTQLNIALQQTNDILRYNGKNDEKSNEAKSKHRKFMDKQMQQKQLIIHVITILGLPNKLNSKMYGYESQYQLYQQILRIILLLDIYKRKQCLETLSETQLMDISIRLMGGRVSSTSVNFKATMINKIINMIPEFMNNYKYYKINQQFHKEREELTEFKKEELFMNWINIAEQQKGLDKPLFDILFPYYSDANEMNFNIDTFGYNKIFINLYNKMTKIMLNKFLIID